MKSEASRKRSETAFCITFCITVSGETCLLEGNNRNAPCSSFNDILSNDAATWKAEADENLDLVAIVVIPISGLKVC